MASSSSQGPHARPESFSEYGASSIRMVGAARMEESEIWNRDETKGKRAAVSNNEHLGRLDPQRLLSDARGQLGGCGGSPGRMDVGNWREKLADGTGAASV